MSLPSPLFLLTLLIAAAPCLLVCAAGTVYLWSRHPSRRTRAWRLLHTLLRRPPGDPQEPA